MSIKVVKAVRALRLSPNEKAVLVAFAEHAADDGTNSFPSVALIAWETDYSEAQVHRLIAALKAKRLLVPEANEKGGRGRIPVYSVCPQNGLKKTPFIPSKGSQDDTVHEAQKGLISSSKGSHLDGKGSHLGGQKGLIGTPRLNKVPVSEPSYESSIESSLPPPPTPSKENKPGPVPAKGGGGYENVPLEKCAGPLSPNALLRRFRAERPECESRLAAALSSATRPVRSQAMYLAPLIRRILAGTEPNPIQALVPTYSTQSTHSAPPSRKETPSEINARITKRMVDSGLLEVPT